jgi:ATP-dependent helicase/nuclease subunit B
MWLRDTDWSDDPEGYGANWTEERTARLEKVNELRRRVREPLCELAESLREGKTAREKVDALYTFMETLGLQSTLEEQMRLQAEAGRLQAAEETAQLWEILCGVLDQFVEILGEEELELDAFARLFRQILSEYSVGTIPVALDQVSVSEITRNDRHRVKCLFLLGANDHILPSVDGGNGVLDEEDRAALQQREILLVWLP